MKVEVSEAGFRPVTITLETKEEAVHMLTRLCTNGDVRRAALELNGHLYSTYGLSKPTEESYDNMNYPMFAEYEHVLLSMNLRKLR